MGKIILGGIIVILSTFLSGCSSNNESQDKEIQMLEKRLSVFQNDLREKNKELMIEKDKQGAIRSFFKDNDKVNNLESEIEVLRTNILSSQAQLEDLYLGKKSHGAAYYLLWGVGVIIAIIFLLLLVYAGAYIGMGVVILAGIMLIGWIASQISWL